MDELCWLGGSKVNYTSYLKDRKGKYEYVHDEAVFENIINPLYELQKGTWESFEQFYQYHKYCSLESLIQMLFVIKGRA